MTRTELSAVTRQLSAVSCQLLTVLIWVGVPGCRTGSAGGSGIGSQDRMALSLALPRLDGGHLGVKLVEVTYPPGGSSRPHSHPCPVVGYVVDGALRAQVKGEPEAVYRAGETFYEAPNSTHLVSANASDKEPAKFVAFFTCDKDTPLSMPLSDSASAQGNKP
jgi:quercetin dioxygenase-like cupin family protein